MIRWILGYVFSHYLTVAAAFSQKVVLSGWYQTSLSVLTLTHNSSLLVGQHLHPSCSHLN